MILISCFEGLIGINSEEKSITVSGLAKDQTNRLRNAWWMVQVPGNHNDIEKRLWDAADEMRANSKLKSSEYSLPVLGLIFLKYADYVFTKAANDLESKSRSCPRFTEQEL